MNNKIKHSAPASKRGQLRDEILKNKRKALRIKLTVIILPIASGVMMLSSFMLAGSSLPASTSGPIIMIALIFSIAGIFVTAGLGLKLTRLRKQVHEQESIFGQLSFEPRIYMDEELLDLTSLVLPLIKEATKIIPQKTNEQPENSHLSSCFGGNPYIEEGQVWPVNKNGTRLEFVVQIFNDGQINIPDHIKLIQLFYDFENWPTKSLDDGWKVKMYEKLNFEKAIKISPMTHHTNVKFAAISFEKINTLPNTPHSLNNEIIEMSSRIDEDCPWEPYAAVCKKLTNKIDDDSNQFVSRLGGHPLWVASYDNEIANGLDLLLQIGSDEQEKITGLNWGGLGSAFIFYNPNNKSIKFAVQSIDNEIKPKEDQTENTTKYYGEEDEFYGEEKLSFDIHKKLSPDKRWMEQVGSLSEKRQEEFNSFKKDPGGVGFYKALMISGILIFILAGITGVIVLFIGLIMDSFNTIISAVIFLSIAILFLVVWIASDKISDHILNEQDKSFHKWQDKVMKEDFDIDITHAKTVDCFYDDGEGLNKMTLRLYPHQQFVFVAYIDDIHKLYINDLTECYLLNGDFRFVDQFARSVKTQNKKYRIKKVRMRSDLESEDRKNISLFKTEWMGVFEFNASGHQYTMFVAPYSYECMREVFGRFI